MSSPGRVTLIASVGVLSALLFAASLALMGASVVLAHLGRIAASDISAALAVVCAAGGVLRLLAARRRDLEDNARLRALASRRADQVSLLSHEIRTPLAIIQGSAELLAEQAPGPLLPRQEKFVGRIIDNAGRMSTLAEQLLMQARLESDAFRMHPERVDLRALIRSVVLELQPIVEVPIVLHAPGAPVNADVDAQLIRQVLNNLISNAARSDPGTAAIEVRLAGGEDDVLVAVSDGGSGMTDAQRDQLFRRFASGRPLGNGTGIGLFISQQLVELHGGRIFVDTITGKGTTMMFTIPRRQRHG
ncbi:sensor histidine kinase [Microbacterium sp.]|uniref:sensor histidine kinase n=1 Tax=Microbacterium sp. TaxID=51671 RepID=UPI003C795687